MFDLLLLEDFLDPPTRDAVLADARAAAGAAATVHGLGKTDVAPRVRHAIQLEISDATRRLVEQRLSDLKPALMERFGIALSAHEPLQFLRYDTGGFFVAHQDGNTPLTRDRTLDRRISIVIFLNAQTPEPLPECYTAATSSSTGPIRMSTHATRWLAAPDRCSRSAPKRRTK
jgi:SM-20-related protein